MRSTAPATRRGLRTHCAGSLHSHSARQSQPDLARWDSCGIPSTWRSRTTRRPGGSPRRNRQPASCSSAPGEPCGSPTGCRRDATPGSSWRPAARRGHALAFKVTRIAAPSGFVHQPFMQVRPRPARRYRVDVPLLSVRWTDLGVAHCSRPVTPGPSPLRCHGGRSLPVGQSLDLLRSAAPH